VYLHVRACLPAAAGWAPSCGSVYETMRPAPLTVRLAAWRSCGAAMPTTSQGRRSGLQRAPLAGSLPQGKPGLSARSHRRSCAICMLWVRPCSSQLADLLPTAYCHTSSHATHTLPTCPVLSYIRPGGEAAAGRGACDRPQAWRAREPRGLRGGGLSVASQPAIQADMRAWAPLKQTDRPRIKPQSRLIRARGRLSPMRVRRRRRRFVGRARTQRRAFAGARACSRWPAADATE
jgi:hypothetical protein